MHAKNIAILGGGQLGAMLAAAARRLGIAPLVLSEDADCPAAGAGAEIVVGSASDEKAVRGLLARAPIALFENEFLDCAPLRHAAAGTNSHFVPRLETIELLQDKLSQKKLLNRLHVPTAAFLALANSAADAVAEAIDQFPEGCVIKWSRLGYDGKGVHVLRPGEEESARAFCETALARGIPLYAEELIDFSRELAIVATRAGSGELVALPLVVSEQQDSVCRLVYGPATALGAPAGRENEARDYIRRVAEGAGLVGTLALELFETRDGSLLVNEIAPRVHNSGHYTMDAAKTSQFENHVRAAAGLALGETTTAPAFAMLNLLGPPGVTLDEVDESAFPPLPAGLVLHWYGKRGSRPGRKLGHVNTSAASAGGIPALLESLERWHKLWVAVLRRSKP
jgi:5-(carboxyamino)imidazole ribonucleotide synthase